MSFKDPKTALKTLFSSQHCPLCALINEREMNPLH